MKTDQELIASMANKLVIERVDLGDERAVLRALNGPLCGAGAATSGQVMALYDRAIEAARVQMAECGQPQ